MKNNIYICQTKDVSSASAEYIIKQITDLQSQIDTLNDTITSLSSPPTS